MLKFDINNYPPTSPDHVELTKYMESAFKRVAVASRDTADQAFNTFGRMIGSAIAATGAEDPGELAYGFAGDAYASINFNGNNSSFDAEKFARSAVAGVAFELEVPVEQLRVGEAA
jgi:hypothetical protein